MSLTITKVLPPHTFADFCTIFNANAEGVPLIHFLTLGNESLEISLPDFLPKTQMWVNIYDDRGISKMRPAICNTYSRASRMNISSTSLLTPILILCWVNRIFLYTTKPGSIASEGPEWAPCLAADRLRYVCNGIAIGNRAGHF